MKRIYLLGCLLAVSVGWTGCRNDETQLVEVPFEVDHAPDSMVTVEFSFQEKPLTAADIVLTKDLLYDKYTLKDTYPYKDTVRSVKWEVMRKCLAFIENMQRGDELRWAVFQNYKNLNTEAPLVRSYVRNVYNRISDTLGVERYQSVPLYLPEDTLTPVRYGRDGSLAQLEREEGSFYRLRPVTTEGEWLVPKRYLKLLSDSTVFHHVIFVDRLDQNIATLERVSEGEWKSGV